ncbi:metallophosphoesterase family protein [Paenibacillus allorhizosphaerae]|uniref:3',5'-cyclic adenosine monophosphate phosphodiesterase CpdA n=1 Tax=Paenibacillus allorhizosphaerae TaxID=2849866 RepID=A0ABN7TUZ6_9BACL|nr:metallophosphoesterase [Paenibacillus allorhizosphaerae]CAG7656851.1 3',5'-cyclic adenosine monophosphate phosphodiesterase CpdA [Paenibacillus allorhizosphaerae]
MNNHSLRFVVMGDLHYVQEQSHREALSGRVKGVTEFADVTRNLWLTRNVTPEVIAAIASLKPDFVIQTGDIIQGHCDDEESGLREMKEAMELLEGLKAPVFFALGTHDGVVGKREERQVKQFVYPAIGKSLGTGPLTKGYYTFEKSGSLFIVLDYTTFVKHNDQAEFIRDTFAESGRYDHVFLFAHPPLFCVGRPFFTHFDFVQTVLAQAADYPVDAYFCGHTHNQISTLHKVGEHWLPQLKSSVLGYPDRPPVHLSDVRAVLPDPAGMEYGWGYLEDSAPGWWEITVRGERVQADWHVLRQGVQGQLCWSRGEKAVFTKMPAFGKTSGLPLPPASEIRGVRLRAAGSNCKTPNGYRVTLNGRDIGALPRLEYFDSRQFMEIEPEFWPLLNNENAISVTTEAEPMCIGGFVLEVETAGGWIRSTVSDYFANTGKWDHWGKHPVEKISEGTTAQVHLRFV